VLGRFGAPRGGAGVGSIGGLINDNSGAMLPGVTVTLDRAARLAAIKRPSPTNAVPSSFFPYAGALYGQG
jgi:hypothetical protein